MAKKGSKKKSEYMKKWLSKNKKVCTYIPYEEYVKIKKLFSDYDAEVLRRALRLLVESVVKKEKKEERRVEDVVQKYNELQQRYNELLKQYEMLKKEVEMLRGSKAVTYSYIFDCPHCGKKICVIVDARGRLINYGKYL